LQSWGFQTVEREYNSKRSLEIIGLS